jgi:hypothetical protein
VGSPSGIYGLTTTQRTLIRSENMSNDDLAKLLVEELVHPQGENGRCVYVADLAKRLGLPIQIVQTNMKVLKFRSGTPLGCLIPEDAESLIHRLFYIHPEINKEALAKDLPPNIHLAPAIEDESTPISPVTTRIPDPRAIIGNFIIIDASNVLHWMKDTNLDDKINLIPLLLILSAIRGQVSSDVGQGSVI